MASRLRHLPHLPDALEGNFPAHINSVGFLRRVPLPRASLPHDQGLWGSLGRGALQALALEATSPDIDFFCKIFWRAAAEVSTVPVSAKVACSASPPRRRRLLRATTTLFSPGGGGAMGSGVVRKRHPLPFVSASKAALSARPTRGRILASPGVSQSVAAFVP